MSGVVCWLAKDGLAELVGTETFVSNLVVLCLSGVIGLAAFALLTTVVLKVPETEILARRIQQKFGR